MRVLIGCEESATVRDAFIREGHDAWSCDLVETRGDKTKHFQMCVLKAIKEHGPWDIIILHPDCTAMAISGNRWYGEGMPQNEERLKALEWTKELWELAKKTARVGCAIENPMSVLWSAIGRPQYIHPWQFGHGETKTTGILSYGLPPLMSTNLMEGREQRIWKMTQSPIRKRDRSKTYEGIAIAMAKQWGNI